MDEIQSYQSHASVPSPLRANPTPLSLNPAAVKTPSNYLRALRRRVWVVLAIAVPAAVLGCIYVLRMPPVYSVRAEIEINPPDFDPVLSTMFTHPIGRRDAGTQERYVPNRAAQLKSARLHERVVRESSISAELAQYEDPATELFRSLTCVPVQRNSNIYIVTLEGRDPTRTRRLLEILLLEFQKEAKSDNGNQIFATQDYAGKSLIKLEQELKELDAAIIESLKNNSTIGPGGRSILEERYVNLEMSMNQKQMRLGDLSQQLMIAEMFPKMDASGMRSENAARIAQLEMEKRKGVRNLTSVKKVARDLDSEPSARVWAEYLTEVMDELEELRAIGNRQAPNMGGMILDQYQRELEADKEQRAVLLKEMQESIPAHQQILTRMDERRETARRIGDMKLKLNELAIASTQLTANDFIKVPTTVAEPTLPVKPNKPILIAMTIIFSFVMGIGLVCLLEHIDHSVKVPEHASHGLTLPLLGVVPRIRRTALTQRGRHLWTPGASESLASDAYRNVRASLLGVADRRGPIITLLVTSAKAGEGKSTTALNLAATCALAGERTLLLDVDLRRPTLAEVFVEDEDAKSAPGVVNVLRGEIPWQRTLRHTRIANLDFIPTGDTRDTPIEILGTLELRQLLLALSHHYDRVILDGPAVLGLADCRFLGRVVDASLLVVRSGSHNLMTLHRAKAMLEQSHVAIAGVVFNGLTEDLDHWSSYGYGDAFGVADRVEARPRAEEALSYAGQE